MKADLPVDPERLRQQFPALTDRDLEAYGEVTRRVLAEPSARGRIMADLLARARQARDKQAARRLLSAEETLALCYLKAMEKMQPRARG